MWHCVDESQGTTPSQNIKNVKNGLIVHMSLGCAIARFKFRNLRCRWRETKKVASQVVEDHGVCFSEAECFFVKTSFSKSQLCFLCSRFSLN